jgi:methionine-rich copper-binding protein CopC
MRRIWTVAGLLIVMLATIVVGTALGHTDVTGTAPANGERLDVAPKAVLVTMSSPPVRLDTATVTVGGSDVTGFARLDPEDARRLVIPIEGSTSGRYVAEWAMTAADGHRISGSASFTVVGQGPLVQQVVALGALMTDVGAALGQERARRS